MSEAAGTPLPVLAGASAGGRGQGCGEGRGAGCGEGLGEGRVSLPWAGARPHELRALRSASLDRELLCGSPLLGDEEHEHDDPLLGVDPATSQGVWV